MLKAERLSFSINSPFLPAHFLKLPPSPKAASRILYLLAQLQSLLTPESASSFPR